MKLSKVKQSLLIIDDDITLCEVIKEEFSGDHLDVNIAHSGEEGLRLCSLKKMDVVLLDQKLPDTAGDMLCQPILKYNDQTKIIFITAFPSYDNAVQAIKAGAHDYLSKPFDLEELHLTIDRSLNIVQLEKVKQCYNYRADKEKEDYFLVGNLGEEQSLSDRAGVNKRINLDGNEIKITGKTGEKTPGNNIRQLIDLAASAESPVLITGETGTGKNVIARAVHYKGNDPSSPFISINCAALPENLVESELFGYEKGAFTGAAATRKGIFEIADGGTLFLDEIGAMPLHLQAKLLGVLDDKRIRRVGGQSEIPVNVRVLAATNANLEAMISEKQFREDLFYRLSVLRIHIPPLRERPQDIPLLCHFFINRLVSAGNKTNIQLPETELEKLMNYNWPGNIRELKNIIERSLILHKNLLHPSDFIIEKTADIRNSTKHFLHSPSKERLKTLEEINIEYISHVLGIYSGNYTRSAKALGISLSTLKRKIKECGINVSDMAQNG